MVGHLVRHDAREPNQNGPVRGATERPTGSRGQTGMNLSVGAQSFRDNTAQPNTATADKAGAQTEADNAAAEKAKGGDTPATRVTLSGEAQKVVETSQVKGTKEADRLVVRKDGAQVSARAGDDVVRVTGRDVIASGGAGNDRVVVEGDNGRARGGSGDDVTVVRGDDGRAAGGRGDDRTVAIGDRNVASGGVGNDRVVVRGDDGRANGGAGDDVVVAVGDRNVASGGTGDDRVVARGDDNRVGGGRGDDRVVATGDGNRLNGGSGDDVVVARGNDNRLNGGQGNDRLVAEGDDNRINAGTGDDVVIVRGGDAVVNAGDGNDRVRTGAGDDVVRTGSGSDRISTGAGDDRVVVNGAGEKRIDLGEGNDTVRIRGNADDFTFTVKDGTVTATSRTDPDTRISVTGGERFRFDGGVTATITDEGDLATASGTVLAEQPRPALVADSGTTSITQTGIAVEDSVRDASGAPAIAGRGDAGGSSPKTTPTVADRTVATRRSPADNSSAANDAANSITRAANENAPVRGVASEADETVASVAAPSAEPAFAPAAEAEIDGAAFSILTAWTPNRVLADMLTEAAANRAESRERREAARADTDPQNETRRGDKVDALSARDEESASNRFSAVGRLSSVDIQRGIAAYNR